MNLYTPPVPIMTVTRSLRFFPPTSLLLNKVLSGWIFKEKVKFIRVENISRVIIFLIHLAVRLFGNVHGPL